MKGSSPSLIRRAFASPWPSSVAIAMGLVLLLAAPATAASYVWNGAGIDGGTGDTAWSNAANWLVGGSVPAEPPGVGDDVGITFNATNAVPALVLPDGAVARHVTLGGTTTVKADNRYLSFEGDAEFATLDYLGGNRTFAAEIPLGSTLTLGGGDAATPTFKHLQARDLWSYSTMDIDGLVTVTADPACFKLGGTTSEGLPSVNFYFPAAVELDFDNRPLGLHGGGVIKFDAPSVITNAPPYLRLRGGRFEGAAGNPADLSETHLRLTDRTDTGSAGNAIFRSIRVNSHSGSSGHVQLTAIGDIEVADHAVIDPGAAYGHMVTGAVYVSRLERTGGLGDGTFLKMEGYNLTVTSAYPVIVGDMETPGVNIAASTPRSVLDLRGSDGRKSTLTARGGLWIGFNGVIVGEAGTAAHIGGDFLIKTHLNHHLAGGYAGRLPGFNIVASTVIMNGQAGRHEPQLLEVHGEDLGPTTAGQVAINLAIGRLEIGTPEQATHVRLVDLADFKEDGEPDALYVGELIVHAGSTLDLCGLNLYVNGETAWGRWKAFGDGMVTDCTVPKGTLIKFR